MLVKSDEPPGLCLEGINSYHVQLSAQEIESGRHREIRWYVG